MLVNIKNFKILKTCFLHKFVAEPNVIPVDEVKRFIVDCFVAVKTPKKHGELMADLLVSADYRGHFSHGMNRLEMYLNDILAGAMNAAAEPSVLKVIFMKFPTRMQLHRM